jgi:hypothetical protein
VDPGEDTGWSVWDGPRLIEAGTMKMWDFSDAVWAAALADVQHDPTAYLSLPDDLLEIARTVRGIEMLVTENWTLYPEVAMAGHLNWDECRTACRFTGWAYEQQPALIKQRAIAAGAESFFYHPLRENRHANDAIMHGVFRNALMNGAAWTDLSKREITVDA